MNEEKNDKNVEKLSRVNLRNGESVFLGRNMTTVVVGVDGVKSITRAGNVITAVSNLGGKIDSVCIPVAACTYWKVLNG